MRLTVLILIISLFLISCTNNPSPVEPRTIDLSGLWESEGVVKLSELAESVEYIALETNKKSILNTAGSLRGVISGDRIFIYWRESNIRVFDRSGVYLFDLGACGQGPEEYINVKLKADSSSKLVWILDSRQHKILKFDFSGNFIGSFRVKDDVVNFSILDDSQIAFLDLPYPGEKKKPIYIQLTDLSGNEIEEILLDSLPGYQGGSQPRASSFFGNINGRLHVSLSPYRNILALSINSSWDTLWQIQHGEKTANDELYSGPYQKLLDYPHLRYVSELPGHILINGLFERTNRYFIYDKQKKATRISHLVAETTNRGDLVGFLNDLDGGLPFWPSGSAGDNSYLKFFNAQRFIDMANGDIEYYYTKQETPLSEDLKSFCNSLSPEDNPVLMIVKFK